MKLKKIWRWIKIIYGMFFIFFVVIMVSALGFFLTGVFRDQQALINAVTMNSIALIMAFISLPGILVQLISLLFINEKKTFTVSKKCPNCKQLIEMKMTED